MRRRSSGRRREFGRVARSLWPACGIAQPRRSFARPPSGVMVSRRITRHLSVRLSSANCHLRENCASRSISRVTIANKRLTEIPHIRTPMTLSRGANGRQNRVFCPRLPRITRLARLCLLFSRFPCLSSSKILRFSSRSAACELWLGRRMESCHPLLQRQKFGSTSTTAAL
jgi:hypothetical protein